MTTPSVTAIVDQESALLYDMLAKYGVLSVDITAQRFAALMFDRLSWLVSDEMLSDADARNVVRIICLALDETFQLSRP